MEPKIDQAVRPRTNADPTTRRKFSIVALAFSGLLAVLGPLVVRMANAFAWSAAPLEPGTGDAMLRMARLLYPHDAISNEIYAEVLDRAIARNPAFAEWLRNAEKALDAQQPQRWADLDEKRQIAAMRAIEHKDFFAAIRATVQVNLYNHPAVWALLGYEGPSFAKGGYINRGAGVIDWLPGAQ